MNSREGSKQCYAVLVVLTGEKMIRMNNKKQPSNPMLYLFCSLALLSTMTCMNSRQASKQCCAVLAPQLEVIPGTRTAAPAAEAFQKDSPEDLKRLRKWDTRCGVRHATSAVHPLCAVRPLCVLCPYLCPLCAPCAVVSPVMYLPLVCPLCSVPPRSRTAHDGCAPRGFFFSFFSSFLGQHLTHRPP